MPVCSALDVEKVNRTVKMVAKRVISVDCGGDAFLLSLCVTFPGFVRGHLCWSLAHIDIMQKTDL